MSDFQYTLAPDPRCVSAQAGSFLAQLDDQLRRLTEATRGLTPEDLQWQPAPGMNTIGMLLTHMAGVEVFWTQFGIEQVKPDAQAVLGIDMDDDGMPLPEGQAPPEGLAGRDLAFFDDLLTRARAYTAGVLSKMTDADFDRSLERKRPDGKSATLNVRWVVYHMLEHFAGHFGQVLLLRHQRRLVTQDAKR